MTLIMTEPMHPEAVAAVLEQVHPPMWVLGRLWVPPSPVVRVLEETLVAVALVRERVRDQVVKEVIGLKLVLGIVQGQMKERMKEREQVLVGGREEDEIALPVDYGIEIR